MSLSFCVLSPSLFFCLSCGECGQRGYRIVGGGGGGRMLSNNLLIVFWLFANGGGPGPLPKLSIKDIFGFIKWCRPTII